MWVHIERRRYGLCVIYSGMGWQLIVQHKILQWQGMKGWREGKRMGGAGGGYWAIAARTKKTDSPLYSCKTCLLLCVSL